jgi:hypothetical protein
MPPAANESLWLRHYASKEYKWQSREHDTYTRFYRPIGLVESTFDSDGRYWEGRADINNLLELEVRLNIAPDVLRRRIVLAWTCLRNQHLLLQAKAASRSAVDSGAVSGHTLTFVVDVQHGAKDSIIDAKKHIVFLSDHYDDVDWQDFWRHSQNAGRVVDPIEALAKIFVFPLEQTHDGTHTLRFLTVGAHHIWDGLTAYTWTRNFIGLLNKTESQLQDVLRTLLQVDGIRARLPLPQEALYPPISGSRARQRWFWLLTRILRHVRTPLQAGFAIPLQRQQVPSAVSFSPTYRAVLDYTRVPPLNSISSFIELPPKHTRRLHRLCREAKASIGAGCFVLAALVMMEMYERLEPDTPVEERKPFISGFPLNPRAFFNHKVEPDSCMLAFSDGITLPFLSSDLPLDGRIRLLVRQAHRQLAAFQKREQPAGTSESLQYMGSRGAGRVLANQYIGSIERADTQLPEELRSGLDPQGAYLPRPNMTRQTCGVSSVGRRDAWIKQGVYDVNDTQQDFVADYRAMYSCVRAREGEFLVGIGGSDEGLWVNASIDASAIDTALIAAWKDRMEHILDEPGNNEIARL